MSVGDSLLDFMDKSEMDFAFLYKDKSFKTTYFDKPKIYDDIQISVKSDDNNYIIHNISGKIYYRKNYDECLKNKIEITKVFQSVISSNVKTQNKNNVRRSSDPTGNSTWSYYAFYLTDGEKIFINYKGKGTGGVGGSGTFVIIGGTGKYENIKGKGFSSRQNLKGKAGFAHSMNQMSGEYTY